MMDVDLVPVPSYSIPAAGVAYKIGHYNYGCYGEAHKEASDAFIALLRR